MRILVYTVSVCVGGVKRECSLESLIDGLWTGPFSRAEPFQCWTPASHCSPGELCVCTCSCVCVCAKLCCYHPMTQKPAAMAKGPGVGDSCRFEFGLNLTFLKFEVFCFLKNQTKKSWLKSLWS